MKYASVCDGIGAAHVAFAPLGWTCAWRSEIDPFPKAVVEHRWPALGPDLGDMTKITDEEIARHGPIDILVGGTPCQSFSVAGLRKGLTDPRGNLTLAFLALASRTGARWLLWENVPGVLSVDGGRAFGAFLGGLAELGYGFAYRVLDAQFFGLAQRCKRVFVVARLGDWRAPAAVLLEPSCLRGDLAPSREAGAGVAGAVTSRVGGVGPDDNHARAGHLRVAGTIGADYGHKWGLDNQHVNAGCPNFVTHSLRADGFDASEDGTGRGTPLVAYQCHGSNVGEMGTLRSGNGNTAGGVPFIAHAPAVAFHSTQDPISSEEVTPCLGMGNQQGCGGLAVAQSLALRTREGEVSAELGEPGVANALRGSDGGRAGEGAGAVLLQPVACEISGPLTVGADRAAGRPGDIATFGATVRRLTPRECERLQGFPDDYTLVPHRGKPAADGPRYKALGNSWAVPVVAWIARRIDIVENATRAAK